MRSRLKKYIGKDTTYTATVDREKTTSVLLTDIKVGNRKITDHVWMIASSFKAFKKGDRVSFEAMAYTYTDSMNIRKLGLKSPKTVIDTESTKLTSFSDDKEKTKRLGWKK